MERSGKPKGFLPSGHRAKERISSFSPRKEKAPRVRGSREKKTVTGICLKIMVTLFFSMGQGKNHYTVSSVNTILLNLEKYHDKKIKRRWLFWNLRWLLDNGFIKRDPRYVRDNEGRITQIPSMVVFTMRGIYQLVKMGVGGTIKLYMKMLKWLKKEDKRFPSTAEFDDGNCQPADPEERKRLDGLLGIVTKVIG